MVPLFFINVYLYFYLENKVQGLIFTLLMKKNRLTFLSHMYNRMKGHPAGGSTRANLNEGPSSTKVIHVCKLSQTVSQMEKAGVEEPVTKNRECVYEELKKAGHFCAGYLTA